MAERHTASLVVVFIFQVVYEMGAGHITRHPYEPFLPEERLVVLAARISAGPKAEQSMRELLKAGVDWTVTASWARRLGAESLLYRQLAREEFSLWVPENVLSRFRETYRIQGIRGLRMTSQLHRVLAVLNREHIPVILLKGCYLAHWFYEDLALRPMSDIDILVPTSQVHRAEKALANYGYGVDSHLPLLQSHFHQEIARNLHRHVPARIKPDGARIELHCNIFENAFTFTREMEQVWERAVPVNYYGESAFVLSPEHLLLHLIFHLSVHMAEGKVTLYWFCDLDLVMRRYGDKICREAFETSADAMGIEPRIASIFQLLERYWETPIPKIRKYLSPGDGIHRGLREILFDARPDWPELFRRRMRLIREIAGEYGWPKVIHYVLRMLVPAREYMTHHYHPRGWKELYMAYGIRLWHKFQSVSTSLGIIQSNLKNFRPKR